MADVQNVTLYLSGVTPVQVVMGSALYYQYLSLGALPYRSGTQPGGIPADPLAEYITSDELATILSGAETPTVLDATAARKGRLRLTGDLGGTADSPTVPGLADKANSADVPTAADIAGSSEMRVGFERRRTLNVAAFGAVGDYTGGSTGTDNLAAFNAATTQAKTTGQPTRIVIPAGRYRISNNWLIDGNDVAVECEPGAEIITTAATTTGATVTFMGNGVLSPNNVGTPQRERFVWRGGKITATGSGAADNALGVVRVKNCYVADVILSADRKGLTAQYGIDNVVWERIRVTRAGVDGVAIETGCKRITLRDITVDSAGGSGVVITSGDIGNRCADLLLDQVNVLSAGTSGISLGLTDRATIRKSRVAAAGTQGLFVSETTGLTITGDCTFPSINYGSNVTTSKPQSALITLTNNWVPFGAPHRTPTAYLTSDGMVVLSGAMKAGTLSTGTRIGTVPVGYRPDSRERFQCVNAGGAAATADIYVNADGGMFIAQQLGSSTILSLSGVTYPAA